MGRKSGKPEAEKTEYQKKRDKADMTREEAAEAMDGISPERIERLENGKATLEPWDVLQMAKAYQAPELTNYYCTHDCAIGKKYVRPVEQKDLPQIAVEALNSLNKLNKLRERLLEIADDGKLTADEFRDFSEIKGAMDRLVSSVDSLELWLREDSSTESLAD